MKQIYDKIMRHAQEHDHEELAHQVWDNTPYIIDVNTGSFSTDEEHNRWHAMATWLRTNFGEEAWPIHGKQGNWCRGGAIVDGWRFIGFHTVEQAELFAKVFNQYVRPSKP